MADNKKLNGVYYYFDCDDVILGEGSIISSIGNKKYYVSSNSFFQVNKDLTSKLYDEVLAVVKEVKPKTVLDLYCGTGTISIYISDYVEKVIGVDYSESGIADAKKNNDLNVLMWNLFVIRLKMLLKSFLILI